MFRILFKYSVYTKSFEQIKKSFQFSRNCSTQATLDFTEIPLERIRNFSIIAHVDHGKSTLADRLLEYTGAVKKGQNQVLDKLQVERERGITVKAQSASLLFNNKGEDYLLNLIDTPGHVDFSNEVSRSLSSCQGVILLVDANDGVQAQTVANFYLAFGNDLVIIPVINKIDLKNADPERVCNQLESLFDIESSSVLRISAKLGIGIEAVLNEIVEKIPSPPVDRNAKFRALLFDSSYDKYRGVLSLIYVKDGSISVGDLISTYHVKKDYEVKSLSLLRPHEVPVNKLVAGQIGLMGCNMRSSKEAYIGDTLYHKDTNVEPLQRFHPSQPMVFAGIYPMDQSQHVTLRSAIEKLVLNDSAVKVDVDTSPALGQGWRLGFLGLLHLEVFSQRLQQEYGAESVITSPSVTYKFILKPTKQNMKDGSNVIFINNPAHFPDPVKIEESYEPMVLDIITRHLCPVENIKDADSGNRLSRRIVEQKLVNNTSLHDVYVLLNSCAAVDKLLHDVRFQGGISKEMINSAPIASPVCTIITPDEYLGSVISLCMERRGVQRNATNIDNERVMLQYELPLCEIILDFHDTLKTITSGYASFDYEDNGYQKSNLVKLSILLNGMPVDELSSIVPITKAQTIGKKMVHKLKDIIPRQMVQISVQASMGGKILARENIKPYRKDVTAKLYGGDVTRRMKLLAQQAAGKKKMRMIANISVPRETFIEVLKK